MKIISIKVVLFGDYNRIHVFIIPRKCNNQKFEKKVIFGKNKE